MISLPVWLPGPMFLPGSIQGGLCPGDKGDLCLRVSSQGVQGEKRSVRHPTGMLSCSQLTFSNKSSRHKNKGQPMVLVTDYPFSDF